MRVTRTALLGWAADFAVTTAAAVFLALIGPFGSYLGATFAQRLLFQLFCFWSGTLVFGAAVRLLRLYIAAPVRLWASIVLMVAVLDLPFASITHLAGGAIWPTLAHVSPAEWYWEALITAEPAVLVMAFFALRRSKPPTASQAAPVAKLPAPLETPPGDVLCLQMEDHYVRVHTRTGSKLVLVTLGQAIAALGDAPGLQVHRSWWVAFAAIVGAEQDGRNLRLRLTNGILVPVARSSISQIRAAGLVGPSPGASKLTVQAAASG